MKFLKGIISLAAIGLACAAVAGKVVKDKNLEAESFGRAHTQKGGRGCGLLFVKGVFKREMNYLEMS